MQPRQPVGTGSFLLELNHQEVHGAWLNFIGLGHPETRGEGCWCGMSCLQYQLLIASSTKHKRKTGRLNEMNHDES